MPGKDDLEADWLDARGGDGPGGVANPSVPQDGWIASPAPASPETSPRIVEHEKFR